MEKKYMCKPLYHRQVEIGNTIISNSALWHLIQISLKLW